MKRISWLVIFALVVGCSPYPRYRPDAATTPREPAPPADQLTTQQFIKLGMILQRYLGRPYAGSSKWDPGVDCSKFTADVFKEYNKTILPRTAAEQYKEGKEVVRNRLKFGDLVFFRTERESISHVGICVGFNEFIHVSSSRGVIISSMNETYWVKRYVGAKRILNSGQ
jgi:cell wall-associated NlpC family hydrolase